jgi:hypothetical protein
MEALLIASGQNVKRLLTTFGGWRPKKLAYAAALHPATAAITHKDSGTREHRTERSWRYRGSFSTRWAVFVTDKQLALGEGVTASIHSENSASM